MPDMLVKLYELPPLAPFLATQTEKGIQIRRAIPPEKHLILQWVGVHFSDFWVSEVDVALSRSPVMCFVAVADGHLVGFSCHDVSAKGFFGPTGVSEAARGRGTGGALLLASLHDLHGLGYAYGIIGAAGPTEFYEKIVGATVIPDSTPGAYDGMLRTAE